MKYFLPVSAVSQTPVLEGHGLASMSDYQSMSMYPMSGYTPMMPPPPGPILVNPPHLPTYHYGVPPSPIMYPGHYIPSHASLPMINTKQSPGLRRAGSINAKILNADARLAEFYFQRISKLLCERRPFANAARNDPHDMMTRPVGAVGNVYPGNNGVMGYRTLDDTSAVNLLRKNQLANEENFMEKIKDWETSTEQK